MENVPGRRSSVNKAPGLGRLSLVVLTGCAADHVLLKNLFLINLAVQ